MHTDAIERLPSAALMRLLDVALAAATVPNLQSAAIEMARAASRALIGARMDMTLGGIMWLAGDRGAAVQVLERATRDPELGASASALLAMLLAHDGRPEWQEWARRAGPANDTDMVGQMLSTARELYLDDGSGAKIEAVPAAPVALPGAGIGALA